MHRYSVVRYVIARPDMRKIDLGRTDANGKASVLFWNAQLQVWTADLHNATPFEFMTLASLEAVTQGFLAPPYRPDTDPNGHHNGTWIEPIFDSDMQHSQLQR